MNNFCVISVFFAKSHLFLVVTTFPAAIGVFIYPVTEAVWGELSLLKIVGLIMEYIP